MWLLRQVGNNEGNFIPNTEDTSNLIYQKIMTLELRVLSAGPILTSVWQSDGGAVFFYFCGFNFSYVKWGGQSKSLLRVLSALGV